MWRGAIECVRHRNLWASGVALRRCHWRQNADPWPRSPSRVAGGENFKSAFALWMSSLLWYEGTTYQYQDAHVDGGIKHETASTLDSTLPITPRLMTDPRHGQLSSATVETIAGLSAGLISTAIVHPLDIIKTRLQVDSRRSTALLLGSSFRLFTSIFKNEGPTRLAALYRGLTPNLVGNSASWALYFLWYGQAQDVIRNSRHYDASTPLSSLDYLAASAFSGTLTAILTNPIWVVKTRMLSTSAAHSGAYPSMLRGLTSIYRSEGLRGYFAGLTPALFGVTHGVLYFVVYERLKAWRRRSNPGGELTNIDTVLTSSLAKVWAGTLTYPHQLVRTRMQTYEPSSLGEAKGMGKGTRPGLVGVIREVWQKEGVMAFYKGLGPNLLRVVPSTCVTFLVYENVRYGLPRAWAASEGKEAKEDAA